MMNKQSLLRQLPSVNELLQHPQAAELVADFGHELTVEAVRTAVDDARQAILQNGQTISINSEALLTAASSWLHELITPTLYPVINATGVIVHTNLGRAPLSAEARHAIDQAAAGYTNLEYDVPSGKRGSRTVHAEQLLQRITGAEAALTVNNNASAVILMLMALCQGKEVIISRGQLVEIGGGFRIPDIMAQSGAKLVEVGTTNRTHLRDYANAITEETSAIMVAHHSNYKIIGFTTEPELSELAQLAHERGILLLYDQGSGCLLDTKPFGLQPEPTVIEGLTAGCDVVAFSGDKLLGGPQAGILCGRADLVQRLKKHPLARAIRIDKLGLAGLSATLNHYIKHEPFDKIPVWRMISRPLDHIEQTAQAWAARLAAAGLTTAVVDGLSTVGGGSLPGTSLPTKLVTITAGNAQKQAQKLRLRTLPIIGRIQDERLVIDPRTVLPIQETELLKALKELAIDH